MKCWASSEARTRALTTDFVPCFLWIFLGAPYVEQLRGNKSVSAGLSAITAAIVGVVLNLAVWFSLHVVFGQVDEVQADGLKLQMPVLSTIDFASLVAMLRFHVGTIPVIGVSAALGAAWYMLT